MNNIPINTSVVSGVALKRISGDLKLLLMKRTNEKFWCHVAGKIENDESAPQAIIREFAEETGVTVTELFTAEYLEQFYEAKRNCITIIPVFVTYLSAGTRIRLNDEHTDFKWCTLEEACALAPFPNQHAVYNHVWEYFVARSPLHFWRIQTTLGSA